MRKEKKEDTFIKHPYFRGGAKAMNDLIYSSIKYPTEAVENKIEGIVIVKYDINHLGQVIDAKVVKGIGHGCDEEAIRVVKLLHFEVPKNPRKLKVTFHKDIHIHFKIPQKAEVKDVQPIAPQPGNPSLELNYVIVPSKLKTQNEKTAKSENKVYTYSLKI